MSSASNSCLEEKEPALRRMSPEHWRCTGVLEEQPRAELEGCAATLEQLELKPRAEREAMSDELQK